MYVLNSFPVASQTFVSSEIDELERRGASVTVVASRRGDAEDVSRQADVYLEDIPFRAILAAHVQFLWVDARAYLRYLFWALRTNVFAMPWSVSLPVVLMSVDRTRPKHIHTHFANRAAVLALILAQTLRVSRSVTTHANDIFQKSRGLPLRLLRAEVATISEFNARYLANLGYLDVKVIRCGVDLERLDAVKSAVQRDVGGSTICSVGRLVPKKGHDTMIRAMHALIEEVPDARLTIVGDGPEHHTLQDLVHSLGLEHSVELIGALPHGATLQAIARSSIFALACRVDDSGDIDGLPVVLLEAAAMRIPIVATTVSGIGELIDPSTAMVVKPDDPEGLADSIRKVWSDPRLTESRSNAALERMQSAFTLQAQTDAVVALFASACQDEYRRN